jgi:hypothetical protein
LSQFSAQYVKGFLNGGSYEASPLEMNAYELEARYAAEPAKLFFGCGPGSEVDCPKQVLQEGHLGFELGRQSR